MSRFAVISLMFAVILSSCRNNEAKTQMPAQTSSVAASVESDTLKQNTTNQPAQSGLVEYEIYESPDHSYGYRIFIDKKLIIEQPNIPSQPGALGFKNRSDAEKVAGLVMEKVKNNQMPPTVTEEELKNLHLLP